MKLTGLILSVLLKSSLAGTYNPEALDYVLRSIEHEANIESGLFRCVFYDISRPNAFRNFLGDVLQSPRLENVLKYVVTKGSFENKLINLPWHPSMLLIYPGNDAKHLLLGETLKNLEFILGCFNPTTKVMVLLNTTDEVLVGRILQHVYWTGFASIVLFDTVTQHTFLFNAVFQTFFRQPPHPIYLFTWLRRRMMGRNITYVVFVPYVKVDIRTYTDLRWIKETARYLNTGVTEYQHQCYGLRSLAEFHKCLKSKANEINAIDIKLQFASNEVQYPRCFDVLYTTTLMRTKIAVPRDRPLNVFELMLMPFSWQVWLLLISIFVVSEVTAQVFPSLFENDPVLLAVCGFERRSLHETRQRETIILHSLMILMFFMSNAYETKIVSLMIDRPAIQRIRTLEDLENSNVKFSGHLEHNSHYVNNSVVGKMIVNGTHLFIYDKVPGFGLYLLSEQTEVLEFTAFDYNRMQPWYVILDYEFYVGPRTYYMSWRNRFLEVFRYIQITLTEAGLLDLWTRQWQYDVRPLHHGQRMRVEIESSKVDLNFEDMNLAWVVLGIGLSVSVVALLGEIGKIRFGFLRMRQGKTNTMLAGEDSKMKFHIFGK
ncbi:uncharacterized protein LOC120426065 [Culex pipiens pallens]|uniref:uncharacterized protein LOC120426065 n=1 Tax=Culex pipiens pallens TaxID=42434 RepID=UPI0019543CDD|nr:uncharacterized protein LOC120426065 [Culex pipiens pallens]